jgi:hypothetical protein
MRKTVLIIFIIILIGLAGSLGYFLWKKQSIQDKISETPISEKPEITPAQKTTLSGKVKEITDESLVIVTEGKILEILIDGETEFLAGAPTQEEQEETIEPKPTGREIDFKDVKVEDELKVFAKEENGEFLAISILLQ